MLNEESDDKRLSEIMKKSMLRMPFSDFEEKVMFAINKQARYKQIVLKDTKLSCFFFLLGTGFGVGVNYYLSHANQNLMGLSSAQILLFYQVSFVLFFLMQLDKIFKLIHNLKS